MVNFSNFLMGNISSWLLSNTILDDMVFMLARSSMFSLCFCAQAVNEHKVRRPMMILFMALKI